ncbi:SIS domain-containing protein [bacterium]|nr:SIS domain-containing protein [bacterium]
MNLAHEIDKAWVDHIELALTVRESMNEEIVAAVNLVSETLKGGHKLLLAGNGGSAADAQHWAAEWVIRLSPTLNRPALPAIALSTDTSILTAGANDLGYDHVFERQVEAFATEGDLLILISTSGNSENLLLAAKMAASKGATTLGILGKDGGKLAEHCTLSLIVPSSNTQRIQEMQEIMGHLLCELSEQVLYGV